MPRCLIALGSNLGDRADTLQRALRAMARLAHVRLLARSRWHETIPIGGPSGQGPYLNGAVLVETRLPARQLLRCLLEIESRLGRRRPQSPASTSLAGSGDLAGSMGLAGARWSARTIDLDLLLYGVDCYESRLLRLPHPRMSFRRFVLEPAVEIAGWMLHPTSGTVLARLLWRLNTARDDVAIVATGSQASTRQAAEWLSRKLALTLGCRWWKHEDSVGPCQVPADKLIYMLQPCREFNGAQPTCFRQEEERAKHVLARTKLVIVWENRPVKDRMEAATEAQMRSDPMTAGSPISRGPLALILTTDAQQALAEALAAIRAIWPAGAIGSAEAPSPATSPQAQNV